MSEHSKACCTIPPVDAGPYKAKGSYTTLNGLKTYVTGPKDADTAILVIYDIMGLSSQIIQGADILAFADKDHPRQVFMPDFFEGNYAKMEWFPPDTEEKGQLLGSWFQNASPPIHLPKIPIIVEEAEKSNPNIKSWGIIGYCWGGKMVSIISGSGSKFKVGVQTSPAMVDPAEAESVTIPMLMMLSEDESQADFEKYQAGLKGDSHLENFSPMPHGWMSARADFRDAEMTKQYERGYQMAADFIKKYM